MKKFIAVEGVIGVGKTTITKELAKHFQTEMLLEIVKENPFLEKFYQDPEHWSFQTECFFLCNRYMQLKKVSEIFANGDSLVSDYHIMKNLIFAQVNLKNEELSKYKALYKTMIDGFKLPDIIVYSEASIKETMRRIKLRSRVIEKDIPSVYLEELIAAYEEVMNLDNIQKHYPGTQVIKINADKVDFFKNPSKLDDLFNTVEKAIYDKSILYQEVI